MSSITQSFLTQLTVTKSGSIHSYQHADTSVGRTLRPIMTIVSSPHIQRVRATRSYTWPTHMWTHPAETGNRDTHHRSSSSPSGNIAPPVFLAQTLITHIIPYKPCISVRPHIENQPDFPLHGTIVQISRRVCHSTSTSTHSIYIPSMHLVRIYNSGVTSWNEHSITINAHGTYIPSKFQVRIYHSGTINRNQSLMSHLCRFSLVLPSVVYPISLHYYRCISETHISIAPAP